MAERREARKLPIRISFARCREMIMGKSPPIAIHNRQAHPLMGRVFCGLPGKGMVWYSGSVSGRKGCHAMTKSLFFVLAALSALAVRAEIPRDPAARQRQQKIGYATYYVKEFEREVEIQRGGEKMSWRSKRTALEKVAELKSLYPGDPEVESLFQRARRALMKSKGDYTEVATEWTAYKRNEETLRKIIAEASAKEWERCLAGHRENLLPKVFPAPFHKEVSLETLKGKYVVLDDVQYPRRQFYGATGEYVASGKPSTGYYFVNIATRDWLGPYEAVKRYRLNVDSGLEDVKKWTVLGEIVDIAAENPNPGEDAVGNVQFGWELKPVALYVPGHVMAVRDNAGDATGRFIGEERVAAIKDGWYTVKEVPPDVTPERLMEIFMTAIKEKNYKLYLACINPDRVENDEGINVRYHWDLHQKRFHSEYVHATFGKAKVSVVKGFNDEDALENMFLDDTQKKTLKRIGGEKVEEATVESRAYDENGKQLGTPHPHKLIRRGGGRWYVEDYALRF